MRITATIDYAATPQEVFAMLADDEFQSVKCQATGAIEYEVSVTADGDHTLIISRRTLPADSLPDFARSIVGQTLLVIETHRWGPAAHDGSREGSLQVEVASTPVGLSGVLALMPGGLGAIQSVEGDLKARIPLIGGKVEQAAAPVIRSAIDVERRTGEAWLGR